jgi:hemerythrin
MAFMEWDDTLSVNVAEIDEQHKKLIGMINIFFESIKDEKQGALGTLLNSLIDYTKYHFSTEEKYMVQFDYINTDLHIKEHQHFTEKVLGIKERFDNNKLILTLEVTSFLKDWIVDHVMKTDKRYSRCFNDNGLR